MLAFLATFLIQASAADSTPVRPISQWVHTSWTAKDGAPTEVLGLAQTTDGYLWLGNLSGLVRFDGERFVPFVPRGGDTLLTVGIRNLLGARDGSLWIVWRSGVVSRLRDGRLSSYGEQDGLPVTHQLAESSTGTLVAGTTKGPARFAEGKWKDASLEWKYPGTAATAVWFDRKDALWVQTEDRVVYLPAGSRQFVDPENRLQSGPVRGDFAEAKDGTIWMAEMSRSAHTLRRAGDQQPISEVMVGSWTLLIDRKGSLWVGSAGDGLRRVLDPTRLRGQKIAQFGPEAEQFTHKNGLLADIVYGLLEDREGNIWVTTSRGVERFREGAFSPIAQHGSVRPRVVFATRDTSLWVAEYNASAFLRIGPPRRESIDSVFVPDNQFVPHTLAQDPGGAVWTAHRDKIWRMHDGRWSPVRLRGSQASAFISLTLDPAGSVWLFDEGLGLLRLSGDSLVRVAPLNQRESPHGSVFSDRQGRIWLAQRNRVALYDHGQLRVFDAARGEGPSDHSNIFEDRAGNLWVVGLGGFSKFETGRFRALPERQGVPGRAVFGIAEDDQGAWWIATRTGVLRLPPGEVDRALADSNHTLRYRSFDLRDGLPGATSGTFVGPVMTRTADGLIWVATDSGVAGIDPGRLPVSPAPPVLIEAVRIDGREPVAWEPLEVPANTQDLEVDYTATTLATPERVQFRYQLEGEDRGWHDVGTRRRAYYTGLGPGSYTFRVTASNGDGAWNEAGATLSFRVLPAWYQTFWFRGIVLLLIVGFGAVTAGLVQRRRHLREQQVLTSQHKATLTERARIAQDLHDTLLQGFAGVALQLKTVELALPEQPDVAAETLLRVQQLARASLREARERVWDMHETELGSDDLPTALEALARERTAQTGIEVSMVTAGPRRRLPRPVEDAAFRIGREAVVNAVRHADARRIEIHAEFGATTFRLEIRDDGRGLTPDEADAARRQGHFGLSGCRERARVLGGSCEVLLRPGGGTIVALELPVSKP